MSSRKIAKVLLISLTPTRDPGAGNAGLGAWCNQIIQCPLCISSAQKHVDSIKAFPSFLKPNYSLVYPSPGSKACKLSHLWGRTKIKILDDLRLGNKVWFSGDKPTTKADNLAQAHAGPNTKWVTSRSMIMETQIIPVGVRWVFHWELIQHTKQPACFALILQLFGLSPPSILT